MKIKHITVIVVIAIIVFSLASALVGARVSEPPEVRQARAAAQIKQVRMDAAALTPVWTMTKIIGCLALMFFAFGAAGAALTWCWKQAILIHHKDGLLPNIGTLNLNRSISQNATMQEVGMALAVLRVQEAAASHGTPTITANVSEPLQLAQRMPQVRVVRDATQIEQMNEILIAEGL